MAFTENFIVLAGPMLRGASGSVWNSTKLTSMQVTECSNIHRWKRFLEGGCFGKNVKTEADISWKYFGSMILLLVGNLFY